MEERDKIEIKECDIKLFVVFVKDLMEYLVKMFVDNCNLVK